ncbi:MAG: YchJ family protein [Hoeflea sp.]|uniref:YchJ family protein n=1 Tax=Hoeflea sp. TaxID=1940281 RepID=UPI00272F0367|nr:YchJ family protein [Hoeflea sp.]MDP2122539.1 YchJ family protein [Hoeflea sp.]
MTPCPCGSDLDYAACCGRFHAGDAAPTAEALMRSRYAAYALGRFDYLEATCAGPASLDFSRAEAEALQLGTRWLGLEIRRVKKGGPSDTAGTVGFIARFSRNGEPGALTETSEFRKIDGAWVYWDREKLAADAAGVFRAPSVGRNDPCPCGSGKKFKKCCG